MNKSLRNQLSIFLIIIFVISCGGGGGGSSAPVIPSISVALSSNLLEVELGSSVTLTWNASNATTCSASGSWSGAKATSGNEEIALNNAGNNSFLLSCTGESVTPGSSSVSITAYRLFTGKVIDGYIRGSNIFIDEDNNFVNDTSERSTTSDNNGDFELRFETGNLLSLGGFDLDSGNMVDGLMLSHPLASYSDFKVVTPITSLILGMSDSIKLGEALGLDSSIDIRVTDPVANKGDNGKYDYLYEKGNQLTVLVLALQNITNDINTLTDYSQDYFKSIAEEIEKEFTASQGRVDIETLQFISNVLDNVMAAKSLTLTDNNKANVSMALASLMPIKKKKKTDAATSGTLNFATSTFQTDILSMAKGESDVTKISQYESNILELIASDQGLEANDLTPSISALSDSLTVNEDESGSVNLFSNDSYLSSSPINIGVVSAGNGQVSITDGILTYTPNVNFNGTDSADYTIIQNGQSSTAQVLFTVNPVNDSPLITANSDALVMEGLQNVLNVSAQDIDGDTLTYSIGGDDASSFAISGAGVLSFISTTTFSSPGDLNKDNTYQISVIVDDGTQTTAKDFLITVTEKNRVPVFVSLPSTLSIAENTLLVYQIKAIDQDNNAISYSLSGTNASDFNLSAGGLLSFKTKKDFENIANNRFDVVVTISDGVLSATRPVVVIVIDVEENQFGSGKFGGMKLE